MHANLLIRRDLRSLLLSARLPLTCSNDARQCATTGDVECCCKAKIRPAELGIHPQAYRGLGVNSCLTDKLRASVDHEEKGHTYGEGCRSGDVCADGCPLV
jgi:hypothetical protein